MKKEAAALTFLHKSDKSTNLHPRPLPAAWLPDHPAYLGEGAARSGSHKKSRRGLFPGGRASVPLRIDFDLMLAKEKRV